jgi:hypothetical protein
MRNKQNGGNLKMVTEFFGETLEHFQKVITFEYKIYS